MFCFWNVAQCLEPVLSQKLLLTLFHRERSEDVDLIFPGRPYELMSWLQRPPALGWLWPGLGTSFGCVYYEALFSRSGAVNTPWELVFSCGFPVPSVISSRSQEYYVVGEEQRQGLGQIQVNFSAWVVSHFESSSVHTWAQLCVWGRTSAWTLSMPKCFATYSLPESGTWYSFRWW